MSGGEQQMVAVARALISSPRLLMLDEPSLGLAPRMVDELLATARRIADAGTTVLMVEQNVKKALAVADRGYVLERGSVVAEWLLEAAGAIGRGARGLPRPGGGSGRERAEFAGICSYLKERGEVLSRFERAICPAPCEKGEVHHVPLG